MINKVVGHVGKHAWKYVSAGGAIIAAHIWGKIQKAKGRVQGVAEQAKRDKDKFEEMRYRHNKDREEAKRIIAEQDDIIKECLK